MASIGMIHSAKFMHSSSLPTTKSNPKFSSLSTPKKIPLPLITSSNPTIVSPNQEKIMPDSDSKDGDFLGKIDAWMEGSVSDIVKNLKEAPLLVQIYAENDNGGIKIQTEKAKWPLVKENWARGEMKSPDGLIFVEELEDEFDKGEGVTRVWGLVVQGRELQCGPACYLLKTDRVSSGFGLGFCTHFCLMKVNNFRDTALNQFKDSWLLP